MIRRDVGTVYLVGAGPGDPRLLTLRGLELLTSADAVVYDRLIHADTLRRARPGARLIFVGKEGDGESVAQSEISRLLVQQARMGRTVVRLKGGDPLVFGRGGEEALALSRAGVPYEVIPGVTSGTAAPAAFGIPLTHRGVSASVTFVTARTRDGLTDFRNLVAADTLVIFMTGHRLAETTRALIEAGRDSHGPAALIEAGTWEHQRAVFGPLVELAERASEAGIGSPALLVVGDVTRLAHELASGAVDARLPEAQHAQSPRGERR